MIVFIVDYPNEENIRDGMMQRVAAIDTLAKGCKRVYLDISFKRNIRRKTEYKGGCTVEHVNYFLHVGVIRKYLQTASVLYVHSIYNLLKIHFLYCPHKTILDIHGVVPEELAFMQKYKYEKIYNFVEKNGISKCFKLIHVTQAMLHFYESKYDLDLASRSLVLPIFECANTERSLSKWSSKIIRIAYVGGLQAWQNIELMVGTIRNINKNVGLAKGFSFHLFFPQQQISLFNESYEDIAKYDNVTIGTLPKEEVIQYLSECHMGYVLRDSIIVNKVACPTKLIEYLECGLVPVIKSPDIGDFNSLGYNYIHIDELCKELNMDVLSNKVSNNYIILDEFRKLSQKSKLEIEKLFRDKC